VEALEAYSRLVYIPVHRMAVRDPMRSMAPYSNSLQRTKRHALHSFWNLRPHRRRWQRHRIERGRSHETVRRENFRP
jgi:hypothetical protein